MTTHGLECSPTPEGAKTNAPREYTDIDSMIWTLLAGVFAPPLLTLVDIQANHSLAPWACASEHPAVLHLVTLVILGLVVLSGIGAARCLRGIWRAGAVVSRAGYLAMMGVFGCAAFTTVILGDWLPSEYLLTCQ